jgi:hypothetical protein
VTSEESADANSEQQPSAVGALHFRRLCVTGMYKLYRGADVNSEQHHSAVGALHFGGYVNCQLKVQEGRFKEDRCRCLQK